MTTRELEAVGPGWRELHARVPSAEIFTTWEWLSTWWRVFGDGRRLLVLAAHAGDRLVGIAPFVVRRARLPGVGSVQRLEFVGTGEDEADEVGTEYPDVLAEPGLERLVARAVWDRLRQEEWDEAAFVNLLPTSTTIQHLLPEVEAAGVRATAEEIGHRFAIELPAKWDDYLASLGKSASKRIVYGRRRLARDGGLEERRITDPSELEPALEELARLHTRRWEKRAQHGAFASQRFTRFHRSFARTLLDRGWLDLRIFAIGGKDVAAVYAMRLRGTVYYYQSGYDSEAFGNLSPGAITVARVVQEAIEQGERRFDFMKGRPDSYKASYAARLARMCDVRVHAPTLRGRASYWAQAGRTLVRDVRLQLAPKADNDPATQRTCDATRAGS